MSFKLFRVFIAQSTGAVQYTDCFSTDKQDLQRVSCYDTRQSDDEVPEMREIGECGVLLHCHRPQVHSEFEVVAPDRVLSMDQMELNSPLMLN